MTIEDLALITQRGFDGLEQRMRQEFKQEIYSVKAEFKQELKATETRMEEKIEGLKGGQECLRQEVRSIKEEQKAPKAVKLHPLKGSLAVRF